jgi:hypothetical protein
MITGLPPPSLVSGTGGVFASIGSSLSSTPTAIDVTITPSMGTPTTISAATDTLAGVLDAARASTIDHLAVVATSGSFTDLINQPDRTALFSIIFDGGGAAIGAPFTRYPFYVPFNATIVGWALMADQVGSISVDIWKAPLASFPPLVANSITGGNPPALSSQQQMFVTSAPAGWTTQINAGDCLAYHVISATTVQVVTFVLVVTH